MLSKNTLLKSDENVKSFFFEERKQFKNISWIIFSIIVAMVIYLALVIILPFFKVHTLIENIPYFGWPLFATLFLFIWIPALFIAYSLKAKSRFTDYQFILEAKSIWKCAMILAIPTFGISLFMFKFKNVFIKSREFERFWKENRQALQKQLWLSDQRPMKTGESASLGMAWLVILFWAMIIIFPIYKLIKQTFNGNLHLNLGPSDGYSFSLIHFKRLFENYNYWDWMMNSLFISIITMIIVVIISAFAGFVYSRYRFKSKKTSLLLTMTLGIMPAAAALAAYYILSVILNQGLGLDAKWLLIFIYAGGGAVGNIFILKGYLDNISTELDDAALIDGCSKGRLFFKIILPLMRPMLAITAIGAFAGPFGDFILPGLLFNEPKDFTLAQGLQSLASGTSADETAFAAGALIIAVPITIVIMISQTFLTKGSAKGGVKG